jgi:hypothetical protein
MRPRRELSIAWAKNALEQGNLELSNEIIRDLEIAGKEPRCWPDSSLPFPPVID